MQNFTKDNQSSAGSPIVKLEFDSEDGILLVGRESGSIDIWEAGKEKSKREIKAHGYPVNSLLFTPDGKAFFSSSYFDNSTKLWNLETGKQLHLIRDMKGPVGMTPDQHVYVVAGSGYLRLFDSKQRSLLDEKYETAGTVTAIATDVASGLIAIGTESGAVDVWKYSEKKGVPVLNKVAAVKPYPIGDWVIGLQFSANGGSLYSVARFGSIDEWSAQTLEKKRSVPTNLKQVHSTAFFRDKDLLALAGTEEKIGAGPGTVEVISLGSGETRTYRVGTNLAVLEYLPPVSAFVAAQSGTTSIIEISQVK